MSIPPLRPTVSLVASKNYTDASRGAGSLRYLVLHSTEGPSSASARAHFDTPGNTSSYHYIIDRDGKLELLVFPPDIAHHAGNWPVNEESIGVAVAGYMGPGLLNAANYRTLIHVVARLCEVFDIPCRSSVDRDERVIRRDGVLQHRHVPGSTHTDLGRNFDLPALLLSAQALQCRYNRA